MKKIMFNDRFGLTKAVLEGRKTMTRRIIPQSLRNQTDWKAVEYGDYEAVVDGEGYYHDIRRLGQFQAGDVVAVAQSYAELRKVLEARGFKRTDTLYDNIFRAMQFGRAECCMPAWTNKMFVKADLMPHHIRIEDVHVERLQDITDEDCMREGIIRFTCNLHEYRGKCYSFVGDENKMGTFQTPREAFAYLIDKISGKGTWSSNPYVFVYSFNLID